MKAIRIHAHGGLDQLRYEDANEPRITSPTDVIIKLEAAAVNHIDIWVRMGATGMQIPMPHILGADGAGVVVDIGGDVKRVKTGDKVCLYSFTGCGECEFCLSDRDFMCIRVRALGERLDGTYAEYVKAAPENCFPIPSYMTFDEGAAFPLVFLTVWRMLVTNSRLQAGETLLIIGIGGGVASAALQVAKRIGARVIVTSGSDEKLERARVLGAEHGINHRRQNFAEEVRTLTDHRGVDVVLDSVAGEVWQKSLASLGYGGRLVTCGATAGSAPNDDLETMIKKELKIYGSTLGSREDFRQLLSFLEVSRIHPTIDRRFPLQEAASAQQRMEEARQFGKILLQIAG
ncbi:MAG TPA: zinc-binding dehydrogenase [Candidatus Binatia bacterium]|jgi:NADPH:quinone reductase-like Zn-dependent oxidoreductase